MTDRYCRCPHPIIDADKHCIYCGCFVYDWATTPTVHDHARMEDEGGIPQ
jgi:hypothetical protein